MKDQIRDKIIELGAEFLDKEDFRHWVTDFEAPLSILNMMYSYVTKDGDLTKLEDLPQERKLELWNKANNWKQGATKENLIQICKAIYLKEAV